MQSDHLSGASTGEVEPVLSFPADQIAPEHRFVPVPRFANTYCSQCGAALGPGYHGVSSCKDHRAQRKTPVNVVVSAAVAEALQAFYDKGRRDFIGDVNAATWFAMYQAQCSATDAFAQRAAERSDKVLNGRIFALEEQIGKVNANLQQANMSALYLGMENAAMTSRIKALEHALLAYMRAATDAAIRGDDDAALLALGKADRDARALLSQPKD